MLDLVICHGAKCEKCGRETECVRVSCWDDSFYGLICWEDLQAMVREKSKDPQARKKFSQLRQLREEQRWNRAKQVAHSGTKGENHGETDSHSSRDGRSWSESTSITDSKTVGIGPGSSVTVSRSQGVTRGVGRSDTKRDDDEGQADQPLIVDPKKDS